MNKIKKALLLALSLAMSATLFAACGGGDDDNNTSSGGGAGSSSSVETSVGGGGEGSSSEVTSGVVGESSSEVISGVVGESSSEVTSGVIGGESSSEVISGVIGGESSSSEGESSNGSDAETPEIPDVPDVDGEQVADLDAWNAAWKNTIAAKNIVAIYQDTYTHEGVTETEYGKALVADNKIYQWDYDDTNGYAYMYAGEVDGKTYQWTSNDGENWEVEEVFADMETMASGNMIVRGLNNMLDFSTATYEKGYYVFAMGDTTFNIKIAGGYVVEIMMFDDTETMSYKMSFGGAVIGELPPLPQKEVIVGEEVKSADEWAEILAYTDGKTNFTYTAEGRVEKDDGKVSIMTEYVAVDGDSVYVEMEQRIHSGGGSAMGGGNRYYQGVVNGVAYQWYNVGDGEFYAQEIEAVDCETIVALLDLTDLIFATAKFDKDTGAYTFNADGATIAIKVVDSLVRYVELSTETMYVEYTISYDNANVELPPLNGGENPGNPGEGEGSSEIEIDWNSPVGVDIIGEEVNEADFQKAITSALKSDNFLVKGYMRAFSNPQDSAVGYTQVADGKIYNYTSTKYTYEGKDYTEIFSIYVGTVGGVEYLWYSEDGKNYETDYAANQDMENCCNGNVFQKYFAFADYNGMKFDTKTGAYVMEIPGEGEGETFSLKIVDGQVVAFCVSTVTGDMEQTFVIEYGNAYVGELPPVGEIGGGESGGGDKVEELLPLLEIDFDDTIIENILGERVTQDELREAIERTYAATNFVLRGDSYIEGGKSLYISHIADGKMRTLTQATYMEEGTGKLETTNMYQYSGNVDGTDYIWLSTDGEIWECALAEEVMVGGYGNGQEVFSSILNIFLLMDSSYNETSKEFYIDMSEAQGMFFSVRVVEGYVKTISMKSVDGMYMNYVVEYDCAEVGALPPVNVDGGDVNPPENPDFDAMGQEVSQGEWEKAFYLFFYEQANVTVNSAAWISMEEYYDETWHKYEGIMNGVIYFSNGEMYERNKITEMEDGDSFSFMDETYIIYKDGTYYRYYSDSIDTPNWVESTVRDDEFNGTLALYLLGEETSIEEYLAMYAIAEFNKETGEYTVYIEDEIDPYTIKLKFVDGLLFSLTIRFEDMESDSERGFVEKRYVFTNYGETYFEYPDFENGGGNFGDEEVVVPEIELPQGDEVNAETWEKAVAQLKAATNFRISGMDIIDTPDYSVAAKLDIHIADDKGFSVATVNGREEYSVVGNVDGKNYEWYSEDGKTWECECTGEAYDIDGAYFWDDIVGADVTFDSVSFDEEIGGYVYDISEMAYVIIGFVDGQVSYVMSYTAEDYGDGYYMEETQVFIFSYGDAVVGELPPVENVVEGGEVSDKENVQA